MRPGKKHKGGHTEPEGNLSRWCLEAVAGRRTSWGHACLSFLLGGGTRWPRACPVKKGGPHVSLTPVPQAPSCMRPCQGPLTPPATETSSKDALSSGSLGHPQAPEVLTLPPRRAATPARPPSPRCPELGLASSPLPPHPQDPICPGIFQSWCELGRFSGTGASWLLLTSVKISARAWMVNLKELVKGFTF